MNGHTALIRSFGTTGVLLLLSLVLLAIVSAIVAFDRWPQQSGVAGTVERVAVDRPDAQRVETQLVRSRRPAPVVRGASAARDAGGSAGAPGSAGALLGTDREPGPRSDGGGFGPPPPPVPSDPPGEGGGPTRVVSGPRPTGGGGGGGDDGDDNPIQTAACGAREALGAAGAPLESACRPGDRGVVRETLEATAGKVAGTLAATGG